MSVGKKTRKVSKRQLILWLWRISARLNQEQLGNLLHVSYSTVSRIEGGITKCSDALYQEWIEKCKNQIRDRVTLSFVDTCLSQFDSFKFA